MQDYIIEKSKWAEILQTLEKIRKGNAERDKIECMILIFLIYLFWN